jgi:hypothetical protein
MGEMRNANKILVISIHGKRSLGRYRYRQENNIKMDLREIGCEEVGCTELTQGRLFPCTFNSVISEIYSVFTAFPLVTVTTLHSLQMSSAKDSQDVDNIFQYAR